MQGPADPGRDLQDMLTELSLADLETLERVDARLSDSLKKAKPVERPALVPQADAVRKVPERAGKGSLGSPAAVDLVGALSNFRLSAANR